MGGSITVSNSFVRSPSSMYLVATCPTSTHQRWSSHRVSISGNGPQTMRLRVTLGAEYTRLNKFDYSRVYPTKIIFYKKWQVYSNYMVSIPKPIGITFKKSIEGYVYVAALDEHGNAAKSGLVIVGDILRKTSAVFGDEMWTSEDFDRTLHAIRARQGTVNLLLQRNNGRFDVNGSSPVHADNTGLSGSIKWWVGTGGSGVVTFRDSQSKGHNALPTDMAESLLRRKRSRKLVNRRRKQEEENNGVDDDTPATDEYPVERKPHLGRVSELEEKLPVVLNLDRLQSNVPRFGEGEFVDGGVVMEEVTDHEAIDPELTEVRSALAVEDGQQNGQSTTTKTNNIGSTKILESGMKYSRMTVPFFIGSSPNSIEDFSWLIKEENCRDFVCFTTPQDVTTTSLAHMSEICRKHGTKFHWFPIRKYDPLDLRRNLPRCVAALTRLLRTNRIKKQGGLTYCFCSEGIGRAPAVAVAYYHWVERLSLSSSYKLVTACQASAPNQWALHQATLDLLASRAIVPKTRQEVELRWRGSGKSVEIAGTFLGDKWQNLVPMDQTSDGTWILRQKIKEGTYFYKFIVDGVWMCSSEYPTAVDSGTNQNNVLIVKRETLVPLSDLSSKQVNRSTFLAARSEDEHRRLRREILSAAFQLTSDLEEKP